MATERLTRSLLGGGEENVSEEEEKKKGQLSHGAPGEELVGNFGDYLRENLKFFEIQRHSFSSLAGKRRL